jgi:hypothetical protein
MGADPGRTNGSVASVGLQAPMGSRFVRTYSAVTAPSAVRFTPR